MKKNSLHIMSIFVFLLSVLLTSCEDVIENLDLETSKERLVIEALINVKKGTSGNTQTIKLSKTATFYNTNFVPATGATVSISNENGDVFSFTESKEGIYKTSNFVAIPNKKYFLKIEYNNQVYRATETYKTVPEITQITKKQNLDEFELSEVILEFTDFENIDNFYRINMQVFSPNASSAKITNNETFGDEYSDGEKVEISFSEDEIKKDDKLIFKLYGVSERFVEYFNLIFEQSQSVGGGLFGTPPSNVKGNCINETDNENYPYGYFSLSEYDEKEYIFE